MVSGRYRSSRTSDLVAFPAPSPNKPAAIQFADVLRTSDANIGTAETAPVFSAARAEDGVTRPARTRFRKSIHPAHYDFFRQEAPDGDCYRSLNQHGLWRPYAAGARQGCAHLKWVTGPFPRT